MRLEHRLSMNSIRAVLFDLDGTLLDTIPDLLFALNKLRKEHYLPDLPISDILPIATLGSKAMIKLALGIEESDSKFKQLREYFLDIYETHLADSTRFFPRSEERR